MFRVIFVAGFLMFSCLQSSYANTIEVCKTCAVSSIQTAIQQAKRGDVILIHEGVYFENNLIVDKALSIRGINYPVLDGNNKVEILTIKADSVTIEGLVLQNAGKSYLKDLAAIRLAQCKNFTIRNNRIENAFFGIYVEKGRDGAIENNIVRGKATDEASSGNAIHSWYGQNILIQGNTTTGHRDGIYLEFTSHSIIADNLSEGNLRYGLHFMFSNNDQYTCNTFRKNGAGVAVMFSKFIQMTENVFEWNWGTAAYGLLLKEIYDANIQDNLFYKNTVGIFVEGAARIQYQNNQFRNNGWAVQMSGGCLDNNFTANNFESNTLDLVVNSQVNNNTFDGNYWSEYSGYDLNHDGIGDVPHRPVKLFSYVLSQSPESIVLLRSFFIDLMNLAEKISPVLTPADVLDNKPLMRAAFQLPMNHQII